MATTLLLNAEIITNSIGMTFVKIPSGNFMMGRDSHFEKGDEDELPQHSKSVKQFAMQTTEVTQTQWARVMKTYPSQFKGRYNPVENVSYWDVLMFIKKLNQKEGTNKYRLPTETEWEYAARAGGESTYICGDNISCVGLYAWYVSNSGKRTHPVAQKKANKWGLYDIFGNVQEITSSCYTKSYDKGCYRDSDGDGYISSRGGSYTYYTDSVRMAKRSNVSFDNGREYTGFRLVITLP